MCIAAQNSCRTHLLDGMGQVRMHELAEGISAAHAEGPAAMAGLDLEDYLSIPSCSGASKFIAAAATDRCRLLLLSLLGARCWHL